MSDMAAHRISLPTITRVALENFDLYSNEPNAAAEIRCPVFCLIGANGLGKSTFLNTVNFAITGAIPEPSRKFQSAQAYFAIAGHATRSDDYFSGRISERARSIASVTVDLAWPKVSVSVTRALFGPDGVTRLVIHDSSSGATETKQSSDADGNGLTEVYQKRVLVLTELEEFAQFVFLMHFVATFDESRHLLMWDDAALTNALYLAFGADPVAAKAADKLQRDMDRESSRGRNVRFSARHVSERINQLTDILKGTESGDHATEAQLQARHDALVAQASETERRTGKKQDELRDTELKWTDLSASLTETQLEYRKRFAALVGQSSSVDHHPIVRTTLSEDRCAFCGSAHTAARIQAALDRSECPLCGSALDRSDGDADAMAELRRVDQKIARIRNDIATILDTRTRISDEVTVAQANEDAAAADLRQFEEKESAGLARIQSGSSFSAIRQEISKLQKEREDFVRQSEAHYKKRDELRAQLRAREKALKTRYEAGSEHFVPRFRELAEAFIGLPIDVELEHRQGANVSGFGLRLRMADQLRPFPDTVSESQRFFLDIALRMALSEYMANGPATLLVDTPEGSLDIAYEARAGSMFSKFVAAGNRVIMTANLRSSQLVLRLAEMQKSTGMQIVRMTDWTDLSEVQRSEESLFANAYNAIDAALS